jgi:hypothetical protein
MERFNPKKLNEVKGNIVMRSQIGLQLWNIWTQRFKLMVPGKLLEIIKMLAIEDIGYFQLKERKP